MASTAPAATATARDVVLAIALFLGPPLAAFLIECWKVVRSIRRERREAQAEAEALRAEGYPPGRPTHHRPSKS